MQLTERELATVDAALAAWEHRLAEGERWIRSIYDFGGHAPLTKREVQALRSQLKVGGLFARPDARPLMCKMAVPTYVGAQPHEDQNNWPDFAEPKVPVLVHECEGVRVIMGTHDWENRDQPDLQIERRPHGWAIFIHPNAGDPVAYLYILDDGRTFVVPEEYTESPLKTVDDAPAEIDAP